MADYKVTDTELTSIANAIRTKGGTQAQLEFPTGFVSAVQAIPTGGSAVVQSLSVTQNGTYNPPSGVDGYAPVTVDVSGGAEHYIYTKTETKPVIDTGVPCDTTDLKVIFEAKIGQINDRSIFGGAWATNGFFLLAYSNSVRWHSKGNSIDVPVNEIIPSYAGKNIIECTKDYITVNGNTHSISGSSQNTSNTLKLFAFHTYPSAGVALYSMKIYQGETLLRDFVPAFNNGEACLLDNVSGNYFYNTGVANTLVYV